MAQIATSNACALLLLILSVCLSFLLQQNKTSGSTSKHRSSCKNRGALQLAPHNLCLSLPSGSTHGVDANCKCRVVT